MICCLSQVANAVGASLGMVSGQCDAIERLPQALSNEEDKKEARKKIVDRCIENAIQNARSKGILICVYHYILLFNQSLFFRQYSWHRVCL